MSEIHNHPVMPAWKEHAHIDNDTYLAMYEQSVSDPDTFWAERAEEFLTWSKKWDTVRDINYDEAHIRWFEGGKLNVCVNALDRHLETRGDQTAIIWEGDDPEVDEHVTYRDMHERVCRLANGKLENCNRGPY